jgi:hypothetical protein
MTAPSPFPMNTVTDMAAPAPLTTYPGDRSMLARAGTIAASGPDR